MCLITCESSVGIMIEITIVKPYKSITAPCVFELPSFAVLTGKNGSGKTHLLEAISKKEFSKIKYDGKSISDIKYIAFNGLNPVIKEQGDIKDITKFVNDVWDRLQNNLKEFPSNIFNNAIVNNSSIHNKKLPANYIEFIHKVIELKKVKINKLTEDDLLDYCDVSYMNEDFFTAQFALIFMNYHRLWVENKFEAFLKETAENTKEPLTDEEFSDRYGERPWDFVNKILSRLEIPYQVNRPESLSLDVPYNLSLKDDNGTEIHFPDLSTGEKVLMSLALAVYNTDSNSKKPDLLLIDEPDAPLHPSMSAKLIEVLNEEIVKKSHIPVIITTHSPTTVIAASGIPIYLKDRGQSSPIKTTTSSAIEELSSKIPFLRISNEKRRQVFVESKYDVKYYEQLVNVIMKYNSLPSEPIFLPVRTSNGSNCEDVKKIVQDLYDNGNQDIYGIIDWDNHNSSKDRILVLGEGNRYAIENYLLDPLLTGLLFLREKEKTTVDYSITSFSRYTEIDRMSEEDAQRIIDQILSDLGLQSTNKVSYKLYNQWSLSLTKEFCCHQGHDLETLYKVKYPFLRSYNKEDALKSDIISKVIEDYYQFMPLDILDVIQRIV